MPAVSFNEEGVTQPCLHQFINCHASDDVSCLWVDFEGEEREYHRLEPGHATAQSERQRIHGQLWLICIREGQWREWGRLSSTMRHASMRVRTL